MVNRSSMRPFAFESNMLCAIERDLKSWLSRFPCNRRGANKMRTISKWLVAIAATVVVGGYQSANAGFVGMPRALGPMAKRISFSNFTLAADGLYPVLPALCRPVQTPADGVSRRPGSPYGRALGRSESRQQGPLMRPLYRSAIREGLAGEKWLIGPSQRRLQRLCGDQAFRIAGARLAHARASSQRSRHLLGRTPSGAGGADFSRAISCSTI